MSGRLDGRVVLITGSGGDIARASALALAAEGARIVGTDIDAELAGRTSAAVREAGGEAAHIALDLSDETQAERFASFAVERYGRIDAIVNNAKAARGGSAEAMAPEDWRFTIDRNLTLPWLATRAPSPRCGRARAPSCSSRRCRAPRSAPATRATPPTSSPTRRPRPESSG